MLIKKRVEFCSPTHVFVEHLDLRLPVLVTLAHRGLSWSTLHSGSLQVERHRYSRYRYSSSSKSGLSSNAISASHPSDLKWLDSVRKKLVGCG